MDHPPSLSAEADAIPPAASVSPYPSDDDALEDLGLKDDALEDDNASETAVAPVRREDRNALPRATFNRLLTENLSHMRAFARSLTDDRAMADDLAQEAATRALSSRGSYHAGTNFRAWVFTIVRNCFYSEHRRKWRGMEKGNEEAMLRAGSPETQESGLRLEDFKRGFAMLSEEQREALVLVGACGFDYQQAAEVSGCAVGTMKSRVSRARSELRSLLDEDSLTGSRADFAAASGGDFERQMDRSLGSE
jgi:RNA polymerase sigma-70 factor (ECF subfamily)